MSVPLQRPSLVRQTANQLRDEISRGAWKTWLPGERELASSLLIGRNTLRAALCLLAAEGFLEPCHGSGHRILNRAIEPRRKAASRSVGLLVPGGLHMLNAGQPLWIDRLRAHLAARDIELKLHHHTRLPRDPQRHDSWVLMRCDAALQRAFVRANIPAVIAGTPHSGVSLPSVDIDHRAVCRHAVGALLALGHRRISLLTRRAPYAGDYESECGFLEAFDIGRHTDALPRIARHDDTRDGVVRAVRALLNSVRPPTALLVVDALHCITASSLVGPGGPVLLCRDDSPVLNHLLPSPAHYASSPDAFVRALLKLLLRTASDTSPTSLRLMPRLIRGETLRQVVP